MDFRKRLTTNVFLMFWLTLVAGPLVVADEQSESRWEKDIEAIEKRIASGTSAKDGIVFVGSSSIRLWKLEKYFPGMMAANHGFGGSVLADSVQYFDRIVVPVRPRVIVMYAGDNDIASKKTPEMVASDFQEFLRLVDEKIPECERVIYIAIKPSVKRWAMAETMQVANRKIEAMCRNHPRGAFLDTWPLMLDANGMPKAELLQEDGLHLNDAGYLIWSDALRPLLTPKK